MTGSARMLIVDDDAAVRDVLTEYFVGRGYVVTAAASGPKGLAAFAREQPDVVLLDIRMSGMGGLSVLQQMRKTNSDVAIIMVTANEDLTLARETLANGAFDYVAKPFDFEHLLRVVAAAVLYSGPGPVAEDPPTPPSDEVWSQLVADVFQAVRRMKPDGRASTGVRLEDAALAAAQHALAHQPAGAALRLDELRLLIASAGRLGDLSAAERSLIDGALMAAQAALPGG
jgi:CheY-like chemotaxis protein